MGEKVSFNKNIAQNYRMKKNHIEDSKITKIIELTLLPACCHSSVLLESVTSNHNALIRRELAKLGRR